MGALVQRGRSFIAAGASSVTITAGVDYVAPSSNSFIYITGSGGKSLGRIESATTGANGSDLLRITNPTNLITSITFSNISDATYDSYVDWEIFDCNELPSTHSIVVRQSEVISVPGSTSTTNGAVVSGVLVDADVVPFLCSVGSPSNNGSDESNGWFYLTWDSVNQYAVANRGASNFAPMDVCVTTLEFTGSAWAIQNITTSYSSVPQNVTIPTALGAVSQAFIHHQFTSDANSQGAHCHITSTTNISASARTTATSNFSVFWLIEDTTGLLNVQSIAGTMAAATNSQTDTITTVADTTKTTMMGCNVNYFVSSTTPGGQNQVNVNTRLIAANQVTIEMGNNTGGQDYNYPVIEWPTATNGAVSLVVNDLSQAQTLTLPTLAATYAITPSNSSQGQTEDNVTLINNYSLPVASLDQAQTLTLPTLAATYAITPSNSSQGQTEDNVTLINNYSLPVASLDQAQTLDAATLIEHNILVVDSLTQQQIMDGVYFKPAVGWLRGMLVIVASLDGDVTISPALDGKAEITAILDGSITIN